MSNRQQQFSNSLPFKIMGEFYWPYEGQPRKATEPEKALWSKCMAFIAEIDLIQPVEDCPHPRKKIRKTPHGNSKVECAECGEFLYMEGQYNPRD
jgi:hypothetical protein